MIAQLQHLEDFIETGVADIPAQDHVTGGRGRSVRLCRSGLVGLASAGRTRRFAGGDGRRRGLSLLRVEGFLERIEVVRCLGGRRRLRCLLGGLALAGDLRQQRGKLAYHRGGVQFGRASRKHDHRECCAGVVDQGLQRVGALGLGPEVFGSDHLPGLDGEGAYVLVLVGEAHGDELAAEREHAEDFRQRKGGERPPQKGGRCRELLSAQIHATRPKSSLMRDALAPIFMLVAKAR